MAQRCSYCGKTEKQHKGKPCVDVEGFKQALIEAGAREYVDKQIATMRKHGSDPNLSDAERESLVQEIIDIIRRARAGLLPPKPMRGTGSSRQGFAPEEE